MCKRKIISEKTGFKEKWFNGECRKGKKELTEIIGK